MKKALKPETKTINIRIPKEDKEKIDSTFLSLSKKLGKRINLSHLIRHILTRIRSLEDLFQLDYITYQDVLSKHLFGDKKDKNNKAKRPPKDKK